MNAVHIENTKLKALGIAVSLFSRKGYSGVSMRDIARTVGISPPALYNHFENKEALYRAAVSSAFEDKEQRLLGALNGDDAPLARLRRFVSEMIRQMHHDTDFRCLMQRELLDADAERLSFLGAFIFSQIQQPFMQLLDELKPGCDSFVLSEMIFGMVKQHYEMLPLHPFMAGQHGAAKQIRDQQHEEQQLVDKHCCERQPEDVAQQVMDILTPFFQKEPING